jgi:hypothetical protein
VDSPVQSLGKKPKANDMLLDQSFTIAYREAPETVVAVELTRMRGRREICII